MIYSVNVKNHEEFEDLVYKKDLNISKVIVDKIFDNLDSDFCNEEERIN